MAVVVAVREDWDGEVGIRVELRSGRVPVTGVVPVDGNQFVIAGKIGEGAQCSLFNHRPVSRKT